MHSSLQADCFTFSTMPLARVNSEVVYSLWTCLQDYQTASMLCVLFHVNFEVAWVTERLSTKVTKAKFFLHFTLPLEAMVTSK